jgi:hypothetical protein
MSSNYLNYELSKQLKELGVEFESRGVDSYTWVLEGNQYSVKRGHFFLTYSLGNEHKITTFAAPSTAQLIDEIGRREKTFELWIDEEFIVDAGYWRGQDPCCTTALGKALIELVKNEKRIK